MSSLLQNVVITFCYNFITFRTQSICFRTNNFVFNFWLQNTVLVKDFFNHSIREFSKCPHILSSTMFVDILCFFRRCIFDFFWDHKKKNSKKNGSVGGVQKKYLCSKIGSVGRDKKNLSVLATALKKIGCI